MPTAITSKVTVTSDEYCFRFDEKKISGIAKENMVAATSVDTGRRMERAIKKKITGLAKPAINGTSRNTYSDEPSNAAEAFTPSKNPGGATWPWSRDPKS